MKNNETTKSIITQAKVEASFYRGIKVGIWLSVVFLATQISILYLLSLTIN